MKQSQFGIRNSGAPSSATAQLVRGLQSSMTGSGKLLSDDVAKQAISMEGYGEAVRADVSTAIQSFKALAQTAFAGIKDPEVIDDQGNRKAAVRRHMSIAQEDAVVVAGVISQAPRGYLAQGRYAEGALAPFAGTSNGQITRVVGHAGIPGASDERDARISMEAYDERNNKDVVAYSVAYNLQASRQGEFGEAFYPTVVVAPDQVGFNVQIRLLYAYNEVQRQVTGALNDFGRKNLIRAIIDATILAVDQTKIIPVYRTGGGGDSSANFVTGITPVTLTVDNAPLTTAPLAIGASFSLLGISQTNANLAAGLEDQTDAIDSSVRLSKVYIKLYDGTHTEYIPFDVKDLPTSDFNAAVQGNTRKLQLNFSTKDLAVTGNMNTTAGVPSVILAALASNTARLKFDVSGSIVQDTGDTTTMAGNVTISAVNDASGNALSTSAGAGATVATTLASAVVVGYDLLAFRTNSNRRNRGKLLDIQHVNYLYTVPLLPPITVLRPVTASDSMDGNLLSDLVTATRTQCANAAVTALLAAQSTLAAFASQADVIVNQPTLFGASSMLVTPTYITESIDCVQALDSIKSQDRAVDLQNLLINKLRDMATRLWVESGYGPAAMAMFEGQAPKPVLVIGTDPYIARYLQLTGDLRLVGDMFDYKIVESFDSRMAGKLIFSFGQEAAFNSGVPNPLHFGAMAWRPELTLMMPMVRNGAQSMELTVQPSYRHVTNLPIMGALTITNIQTVIGSKVMIDMHTV